MEINYYRQKLLNAILYFVHDTKRVNLTKLLKLLYFLDFTHFRETSYPSLNLSYYALKWGPVPTDFYEEVKNGIVPEDFVGKFAIIPSNRWEEDYPERKEYIFKPIEKPDATIFTPRELKIIKNLCEIYRDATASQMSEVTHLHNKPWDTTIKTKGFYQYIDYLLSIDDTSSFHIDEARDRFKEHLEVLNNLGLNPRKW